MGDIPREEKKRMKDLERFVRGKDADGQISEYFHKYWIATNLLPGAMREAGVQEKTKEKFIDRVKRRYSPGEEKYEGFSTKIEIALERSGTLPEVAAQIAKLLANKWMVKQLAGEPKGTWSVIVSNAYEKTPKVYDLTAYRIHRIVSKYLESPTQPRATWVKKNIEKIVRNFMLATREDSFSEGAVLAMDIIERPKNIVKIKSERDLNEYLKRRLMETHAEYKKKSMLLAAITNQIYSLLFYLAHGIPYIPRGVTKQDTIFKADLVRKHPEWAKETAKIAYDTYERVAKEVAREQGIEKMFPKNRNEAIKSLEQKLRELEEIFPFIRQRLKRKRA